MRFSNFVRALALGMYSGLQIGSIANCLLVATTYARIATYCPSGEVCYSVNVPESTASKGTGDIFFQITGPSSLHWIGLGQGASMTGANIFMVFPQAAGAHVTLSASLGVGDQPPKKGSTANVTLLPGSGILNGIMTANVRCTYIFGETSVCYAELLIHIEARTVTAGLEDP
jgi:hypothetical protein